MTASAMMGDRERCLAAGMDGYLSKPINAKELDAILDRSVEGRHNPMVATPKDDSSTTPVNFPELLQRFDGDRILLAELLTIFREDYPGQIRNAQQAIAQQNAAEVERWGHSLKGALGNLSAVRASALAGEFEAMGRSGNLALAGSKLAQVEDELQRVMEAFDSLP
jgi:two-component system sensor histidine kinase/response regulator